jgi:hypothetical protein
VCEREIECEREGEGERECARERLSARERGKYEEGPGSRVREKEGSTRRDRDLECGFYDGK